MTRTQNPGTAVKIVLLAAAALSLGGAREALAEERPLEVCATVTDLGAIARAVGGDDVLVTVFTPGRGDPHFNEARPSFVKAMSRADVFIMLGLDMEVGWAPPLWETARNPKVLPGGAGFVDASRAIEPIGVPATAVDRSMGDLHVLGNPHYLLDPLNGVRVAALVRDALAQARPEARARFERRFEEFRARVGAALFGPELAKKYDPLRLGILHEHGRLEAFLREQGEEAFLGGWAATLAPFRGTKVVADHQLWPYFARRYGIEVIGHMEPKPGIPPTAKHLAELVRLMRAEEVKIILSAAYYDPRHAAFLAEQTGARVVPMAHQVEAREGTGDFVAMHDYNVRVLAEALRSP